MYGSRKDLRKKENGKVTHWNVQLSLSKAKVLERDSWKSLGQQVRNKFWSIDTHGAHWIQDEQKTKVINLDKWIVVLGFGGRETHCFNLQQTRSYGELMTWRDTAQW